MPQCTRVFEFDSAHRVLRHGSKCRYLHGHRYKMEVTVETPELNDLGMVMDFGEIKAIVQTWVDDNWDHNIILNKNDPLLYSVPQDHYYTKWPEKQEVTGGELLMGGPKPPYIMGGPIGAHDINPTAENMAIEAAYKLSELMPWTGMKSQAERIHIAKLRLYETPNCWAEVVRVEFQPDINDPTADLNKCFRFV